MSLPGGRGLTLVFRSKVFQCAGRWSSESRSGGSTGVYWEAFSWDCRSIRWWCLRKTSIRRSHSWAIIGTQKQNFLLQGTPTYPFECQVEGQYIPSRDSLTVSHMQCPGTGWRDSVNISLRFITEFPSYMFTSPGINDSNHSNNKSYPSIETLIDLVPPLFSTVMIYDFSTLQSILIWFDLY